MHKTYTHHTQHINKHTPKELFLKKDTYTCKTKTNPTSIMHKSNTNHIPRAKIIQNIFTNTHTQNIKKNQTIIIYRNHTHILYNSYTTPKQILHKNTDTSYETYTHIIHKTKNNPKKTHTNNINKSYTNINHKSYKTIHNHTQNMHHDKSMPNTYQNKWSNTQIMHKSYKQKNKII